MRKPSNPKEFKNTRNPDLMLKKPVASMLSQITQRSAPCLRRSNAPSGRRPDRGPGPATLLGAGAAGWMRRLACLTLWLGLGALAHAQPANDDFSNASIVSNWSGSVTGSTFGASKEFGEPLHAGNFGGASIWFSWQAPASGKFTFDTIDSDFDTLLAVYTGASVSGLTVVASDDDISSGFVQSAVQFTASAGTTYKIAVDGYAFDGDPAEEGSVVLTWGPKSEIVSTGPLTNITVGAEGSFQVYHSNFQNGQVYPPLSAPISADAGFFVRLSDGTVNGLNLNRPTAAGLSHAISFHPISQSVSQNGREITVVMDNSNDGTANRFQVTQVTRYRPGDEYFVVENTVLNQGASAFTADLFTAADLYLADSDFGYGFQHSSSATVGGIDQSGLYHIFVQGQPGNPLPVLFQEDDFFAIWQSIGTPGQHFANTIREAEYIDNGAGLEWPNVTLAPGASVRLGYTWAFGALSDLAVTLTASPDPVNGGGQITYQAIVTNIGAVTVTNVALSDVLPSGVSFVSASSPAGSCQNQGGTITCSLGTLASGQSVPVTIRLQATAAGMITNKVAVSGNQADIDLSNNAATAQVTALGDASPVLSIRAAGPNVVLSWPDICASCVLQQVDHLNPPPIMWMSVGAPVMTINGTNQVTLPRGTNNRFFQLGPGP